MNTENNTPEVTPYKLSEDPWGALNEEVALMLCEKYPKWLYRFDMFLDFGLIGGETRTVLKLDSTEVMNWGRGSDANLIISMCQTNINHFLKIAGIIGEGSQKYEEAREKWVYDVVQGWRRTERTTICSAVISGPENHADTQLIEKP